MNKNVRINFSHIILILNFMFQPHVKSLSHRNKTNSFKKQQSHFTSTEVSGDSLRIRRVWKSMKQFINIIKNQKRCEEQLKSKVWIFWASDLYFTPHFSFQQQPLSFCTPNVYPLGLVPYHAMLFTGNESHCIILTGFNYVILKMQLITQCFPLACGPPGDENYIFYLARLLIPRI